MKNYPTFIRYLLLASLIFPVLSCNSYKKPVNKTIDIVGALEKNRIVNLSEIAGEITYIPLETTDSSLIGELPGILLPFVFEDHMFMTFERNSDCKVFDESGKFIRKFNKSGRGPQEHGRANHAYFFNKRLVVLNDQNDFLEYGYNGDFIGKISMPAEVRDNYKISYNNYAGNNLYISSLRPKINDDGTPGKDPDFCAVLYDTSSKVVAKIPFPFVYKRVENKSVELKINGETYTAFMDDASQTARFYTYNDEVRICFPDKGTIYSINKELTLDTLYHFILGEYQKTPENSTTLSFNDSKVISPIITEMETERYLFLWLNLRALANDPLITPDSESSLRTTYGIFDKQSGETTLMNMPVYGKKGFKEDLQGGPPFWPKSITSDGKYMVGIVDAIQFITYAEENDCPEKIKRMAEKMDENDNPIAILVKLKK